MTHGKSIGWSHLLLIYLLLVSAGIIAYGVAYVFTYTMGSDQEQVLSLLLQALPFAYVFFCFLTGLYFYAWYVDMFHLLPGFSQQPQQVLWRTLLPVVQVYGIAAAVNKVARAMDAFSTDDRWYGLSQRLLTMLAAVYAALLAVGLALLFGNTLPPTTEMVNQTMVTVFHLSAAVAGLFLLLSFGGLIMATRAITVNLQRSAS